MKTFAFTLIASGFDPEGDYESPLFEAGCDDATISVQKGLLILEFDREAESFGRAVASACADVARAGFRIERVEPDFLVSLSEIAERANLSRQAITLYAKGERGSGFPAPAAKVMSKHPLWDWYTVAQWLHEKNFVALDAVTEAKVVREVNTLLASHEVMTDSLLHRLAQLDRL